MSLHYENTVTFSVIGSKSAANVITPVTLTDSYDVANKTKIFETSGFTKGNFDIQYTTGAGETANSIELRLEGSPDGSNFFRLPNETASLGVSTLTQREFTFVGAAAATTYTISIGIDIFYKYMRASVKETGVTTTFGTVYVGATLCGK